MKKLYIGSQHFLNTNFIELGSKQKNVIWLYDKHEFPFGWKGIQCILLQLKTYMSDEVYESTLQKHKAIVSFAIPSLIDNLSKEEREVWYYYSTKFFTQTNRPIFINQQFAKALYAFLKETDTTLLIPDLSHIDSETLGTLVSMFQQFPDFSQKIIFGIDKNYKVKETKYGISWEQSDVNVQSFINSMQLFEDYEKIEGEEASSLLDERTEIPTAIDLEKLLSENEELLLLQLLKSKSEETIKTESNQIVKVVRRSFERYSYKACIYLGLAALEFKNCLTEVQKGKLHGLIGSAGHFDQLSHHEHPIFDNFLKKHLLKALDTEKDTEKRCSLLYRLVYTLAERQDDWETSIPYVEQEIKEASSPSLSKQVSRHQLAWAYSIKAHIYVNKAVLDVFNKCIENTFKLLDEQLVALDRHILENNDSGLELQFLKEETLLSYFHFAAHQVFFGDELGMFDYSMKWIEPAKKALSRVPERNRFDVFHWIEYHRSKFELINAFECCKKGIQDAYTQKHTLMYLYQFCAADVCYRMGDYKSAEEYYQQAKTLRPYFHDPFGSISIDLLLADCYLKNNKLEESRKIYEQYRDKSKGLASVKTETALSRIAALQKRKEDANVLINEAIELAVATGEKNTILFIAVSAGEIAWINGQKSEAAAAFKQSLDFIIEEDGTFPKQLSGVYALKAVLGYYKTNEYDEKWLKYLLTNINSHNILDESDGWILLKDILHYTPDILQNNAALLNDETVVRRLRILVKAGKQRKDGKENALKVQEILETHKELIN
ncbi:tetratricopeptide repeat protein [Flavobacteriaceae bacterium M23B6Z8]